jgi:predicted membrane chloride channel (bestrophin family)
MKEYQESNWGFNVLWGISGSVFPRAIIMAVPSAIISYLIAMQRTDNHHLPDAMVKSSNEWESHTKNLLTAWGAFTTVLFFLLQGRTNTAYSRWWEGGTLLQQVRGEWFNAYSSLIAFSSPDPKMVFQVEEFHHLLARFMSLLFCSGLQQVSPNRDKSFEVLDITGIDQQSIIFLQEATDKVEVILQWIQRSIILNMSTGVLPIPPPVMSRAFQELSRGIVNLQNARKIADFPYPFPNAQTCMVILVIHWFMSPFVAAMLLSPVLSALATFLVIFFVWSLNFIALQLERPFGERPNDLPMDQMQADWNQSLGTLLSARAQKPPKFGYNQGYHRQLDIIMSADILCRGPVDNPAFDRQVKRLLVPGNSFLETRNTKCEDKETEAGNKSTAASIPEATSEALRRESAKIGKESCSTSKLINPDRKTGGVKLVENVVMRLCEMEHANNSSAYIETCKEKNTSKPAMSEITVTTQSGGSSLYGGASHSSDQSRIRGVVPSVCSDQSRSGGVENIQPQAPSAEIVATNGHAVSEGDVQAQEPGESLSHFKARMEASHQRIMALEATAAAKLAMEEKVGDSAGGSFDPSNSRPVLSPCSITVLGDGSPNPRAIVDPVATVAGLEL